MGHTFINISFEDPDSAAPVLTVDGDAFEPEGWSILSTTNSVEETADFGASAGAFTESSERFEAHWTGLASHVFAFEVPDNPAEVLPAQFNTGINATAFDAFEREWDGNELYLFGLGSVGIAPFALHPRNELHQDERVLTAVREQRHVEHGGQRGREREPRFAQRGMHEH